MIKKWLQMRKSLELRLPRDIGKRIILTWLMGSFMTKRKKKNFWSVEKKKPKFMGKTKCWNYLFRSETTAWCTTLSTWKSKMKNASTSETYERKTKKLDMKSDLTLSKLFEKKAWLNKIGSMLSNWRKYLVFDSKRKRKEALIFWTTPSWKVKVRR